MDKHHSMAKGKAAKRKRARKRRAITGHGDYTYDKPGPWGKAGREVGRMLGSYGGRALGNYLEPGVGGAAGSKFGSWLGGKVGGLTHYLARLWGSGDYHFDEGREFRKNSLFTADHSYAPSFGSGAHGTRIRRREYIGDIVSETGDTLVAELPLAIGDERLSAWLAGQGQFYQKARVDGMVVEYVSESGPISTTQALGYVAIAVGYDPVLPAPTTKRDVLGLDGAQSYRPTDNQLVGVECAPDQQVTNMLYTVPASGVPSGAPLGLYQFGTAYVMVGGQTTPGEKLGELWLTYDVTLASPKNPDDSPASGTSAYSATISTGGGNYFSTISNVKTNDPGIVPSFNGLDYECLLPRPSLGQAPRYYFVMAYVENDPATAISTTDAAFTPMPDEEGAGVTFLNAFSPSMHWSTSSGITSKTFTNMRYIIMSAVVRVAYAGENANAGIAWDTSNAVWNNAIGTFMVAELEELVAEALAGTPLESGDAALAAARRADLVAKLTKLDGWESIILPGDKA